MIAALDEVSVAGKNKGRAGKMQTKRINTLGILSILIIGLPSYAHARGGCDGDFIASLLISLLVILVVFLILREVVCWYWKINETLSVLKEIRDLLKSNPSAVQQNSSNSPNVVAKKEEVPRLTEQEMYDKGNCPECGATVDRDQERCPECETSLTQYMK